MEEILVRNDVFARFGRDEDKVTFSCLSGITKVSHIQKQLTYFWHDTVLVIRL